VLLQNTATRHNCNMVHEVLQHLRLRVCVCYCNCNTLQLTTTTTRCAKCCNISFFESVCVTATHCNSLQLQHGTFSAATFVSSCLFLLQQHTASATRFAKCCNICVFGSVLVTATHCNCNAVHQVLQQLLFRICTSYCNTLQHTASH